MYPQLALHSRREIDYEEVPTAVLLMGDTGHIPRGADCGIFDGKLRAIYQEVTRAIYKEVLLEINYQDLHHKVV